MSERTIGQLIHSTDFEWKVTDYSTLYFVSKYDFYESPFFKFADSYWNLRIFKGSSNNYQTLLLYNIEGSFCDATCSLSIKKSDGTLHGTQIVHVMGSHNFVDFIDKSVVEQRDFEVLSSDILTITCTLEPRENRERKRRLVENAQDLKQNVTVENLERNGLADLNLLSEKIKGLFTAGEFCDVTLNVNDKEFKAHKAILAARSPVFFSYFKHETLEKRDKVVDIPDCDPGSFHQFLEYLYSGKLENISFSCALHLYRTADKYDVQELKAFCVDHMKRNFSAEFFCDAVALAELYNDKELFSSAQDFFNRNLREIFATAEWKDLMKNSNNLANTLLMEMSSCVQVVSKRPRLE